MKISYNWLRQYLDYDITPEDLSVVLTNCGLEVEDYELFETVRGGLDKVLIGRVLECERHPNADKLSLTKVDVGKGTILPIVCGAPNVAKGQKVVVATVGAVLYGNDNDKPFEIKEARIRGEVSQGMICAEDEVGLGASHAGIMVLPDDAEVGMAAAEYFKIERDYVFSIGLTPNRTDATSHLGVTRDLIAVLNAQRSLNLKLNTPDVSGFSIDDRNLDIPVEIVDADACPRYSGVSISGVTIKDSPAWMKNRLTAIGIRPINNIVDITNYVLMETGQPLHAFDADKIQGKKVVVRKARPEEKFITLDEVERNLIKDDLMICDTADPMCIGGIFGGAKSGVSVNTCNIFLESAHFNPVSIRKSSRYHGLQTDASFRFERGSDPNITIYALKRAALLIKELAGGKISSEIKDVYPVKIEPWKVRLRYWNLHRLAGIEFPKELVKKLLHDIGIQITGEDEEGLDLLIPTFKVDVTREADVIEEILRIYGYNNVPVPEQLRASLKSAPKPDMEKLRNIISDMLVGEGFSEIMNNSLTRESYATKTKDFEDAKKVPILNPLSNDLGIMRFSLFHGGMETIAYNQNRKNPDLKLFEFGRIYIKNPEAGKQTDVTAKYAETECLTVFLTGRRSPENWNTPSQKSDFYDLKAVVQNIFKRLGLPVATLDIENSDSDLVSPGFVYKYKGSELCRGGQVSRKWQKEFDVKQEAYFAEINWDLLIERVKDIQIRHKELPKFPEVRRDLALIIDKEVTFRQLRDKAFDVERKLLRSVNLFDVYEGKNIAEGKKSYALSFILQDDEKTLTDQEIEKVLGRLMKAFIDSFNATIRSGN